MVISALPWLTVDVRDLPFLSPGPSVKSRS
jgi:hypothetical protein